MESDNLDLRDELAGLMGSGVIYSNNSHPVANTLDAASAAIRAAGREWAKRDGEWVSHTETVPDTGNEVRDLLTLACDVWKAKNKEQKNGE